MDTLTTPDQYTPQTDIETITEIIETLGNKQPCIISVKELPGTINHSFTDQLQAELSQVPRTTIRLDFKEIEDLNDPTVIIDFILREVKQANNGIDEITQIEEFNSKTRQLLHERDEYNARKKHDLTTYLLRRVIEQTHPQVTILIQNSEYVKPHIKSWLEDNIFPVCSIIFIGQIHYGGINFLTRRNTHNFLLHGLSQSEIPEISSDPNMQEIINTISKLCEGHPEIIAFAGNLIESLPPDQRVLPILLQRIKEEYLNRFMGDEETRRIIEVASYLNQVCDQSLTYTFANLTGRQEDFPYFSRTIGKIFDLHLIWNQYYKPNEMFYTIVPHFRFLILAWSYYWQRETFDAVVNLKAEDNINYVKSEYNPERTRGYFAEATYYITEVIFYRFLYNYIDPLDNQTSSILEAVIRDISEIISTYKDPQHIKALIQQFCEDIPYYEGLQRIIDPETLKILKESVKTLSPLEIE